MRLRVRSSAFRARVARAARRPAPRASPANDDDEQRGHDGERDHHLDQREAAAARVRHRSCRRALGEAERHELDERPLPHCTATDSARRRGRGALARASARREPPRDASDAPRSNCAFLPGLHAPRWRDPRSGRRDRRAARPPDGRPRRFSSLSALRGELDQRDHGHAQDDHGHQHLEQREARAAARGSWVGPPGRDAPGQRIHGDRDTPASRPSPREAAPPLDRPWGRKVMMRAVGGSAVTRRPGASRRVAGTVSPARQLDDALLASSPAPRRCGCASRPARGRREGRSRCPPPRRGPGACRRRARPRGRPRPRPGPGRRASRTSSIRVKPRFILTDHEVTSAFSPSPPGAPSAPRLQMS